MLLAGRASSTSNGRDTCHLLSPPFVSRAATSSQSSMTTPSRVRAGSRASRGSSTTPASLLCVAPSRITPDRPQTTKGHGPSVAFCAARQDAVRGPSPACPTSRRAHGPGCRRSDSSPSSRPSAAIWRFAASSSRRIGIDMGLNRGAAIGYEADLILGARRFGQVWFHPRLAVDHWPGRRVGAPGRDERRRYIEDYSYNLWYIAAKHFTRWERVRFETYMWLVGQKRQPGSAAQRQNEGVRRARSARGRSEGWPPRRKDGENRRPSTTPAAITGVERSERDARTQASGDQPALVPCSPDSESGGATDVCAGSPSASERPSSIAMRTPGNSKNHESRL